ncbi:MAG: ATP-dependent zinc metalloprotease FtsH [Patescibacteria group bacterium]|nr:ATP-dependent zinc metalloprotease FtsH [Patescibacteria group bacterium]
MEKDTSLGDMKRKISSPLFKNKSKGNKNLKNIILYGFLALVLLGLFFSFSSGGLQPQEEKSLTQALDLIRQERVKQVTVSGDTLELELKNGDIVVSRKEAGRSFLEILETQDISPDKISGEINVEPPTEFSWLDFIINVLPVVLMLVFFFILFRKAGKGSSGGLFSIGKSKATLFGKDQPQVSFDDAAGVDEAKKELREVVDFLENPDKYRKLGARIPKGVLLVGPAGTGKTLLARAVASEAGVPFFSVAGSEFMEMLVGVGSARVRDLFQTAKQNSPSLIFIDEIETIGRHRGMSFMSQGEQEQTLNQILTEMDGFEPNAGVVVLGATNKPEMLDPALVRPGRFDRRIILTLPDIEGRKGILKIHMRGKPFTNDVNVEELARRTVGFSGADIENMLNEAAILAARGGKEKIGSEHLEEAATKVKLGPQRKRLKSEEERRLTAFHEAGHAVVAHHLPKMDPVHRVSIVARGLSLGFTMIPPKIDRYNETRSRLLAQIIALLGGRAAEKVHLSEFSIGASSDIEKATQLAREMVTKFGMSKLGPMSFEEYLGEGGNWPYRSPVGGKVEYSEEMRKEVDKEVKRIIEDCYEKAEDLVKKYSNELQRVVDELMEKETLSGDEFEKLVGEKKDE